MNVYLLMIQKQKKRFPDRTNVAFSDM